MVPVYKIIPLDETRNDLQLHVQCQVDVVHAKALECSIEVGDVPRILSG